MVQVQYVILEGDIETMINTTNIFDYEDVQLIPNKCIVSSRSECDTHVKLGKRTFRLPVVPANMQTIIDEELAEKLAREGDYAIPNVNEDLAPIASIVVTQLFAYYAAYTKGLDVDKPRNLAKSVTVE